MTTTPETNTGQEKRIRLGIPLDLLLDRDNNKLSAHEKEMTGVADSEDRIVGGIQLPDESSGGSGNIVIRGRPGSGKTILALQMAQKCCQLNEGVYSWFISMEEDPEHLRRQKATNFGWEDWFQYVYNLNEYDEQATPENYAKILKRVITSPSEGCPLKSDDGDGLREATHNPNELSLFHPKVYLSRLSPRHLSARTEEEADIFEERFSQLKKLLSAAAHLKDKGFPRLAMVCIDSLNVFGDRLLGREQIYRLFDLFSRYQVIGVFVLEEDEGQVLSSDSRLHGDVIEYLADVVIALQYDYDEGYFVRYFEIVKSRHLHQVYGKHPFKIIRNPNKSKGKDEGTEEEIPTRPVQYGFVIYPSLHYIVYGTEREKEGATDARG